MIEITDPQQRTKNSQQVTYNCNIRYRGANALSYEKKSFAVKLVDGNGEDLDASLFQLRNDNNWILDAMAIDRIRMRNRVLFDIWNEYSTMPYDTDYDNRNGTVGLFVELYLNGEYHGLYCLTDKINRKLLGLKKLTANDQLRGVLYKCTSWGQTAKFTGYDDTAATDGTAWQSWELKYPDDPVDGVWQPLQDIIDFCTDTDDETFAADAEQHFYWQNILDYHLFYLAYALHDNIIKNTYLSIRDINETRQCLITPWDLDCSIGGSWDGLHITALTNNSSLDANPFMRLWNDDSNQYRAALASRWRELRLGSLSATNLQQHLQAYADAFVESGAWQREYNQWNNNPVPLTADPKEELDYVCYWYNSNWTALDNFFNDY